MMSTSCNVSSGKNQVHVRSLMRLRMERNITIMWLRLSVSFKVSTARKRQPSITRFIKDGNLTGEQEQYLKEILNYLSENGDLQMSDFMEYPLNRNKWRDVFGEYFVGLKDFVNELHNVISQEVLPYRHGSTRRFSVSQQSWFVSPFLSSYDSVPSCHCELFS